jgi:hypothetical protein
MPPKSACLRALALLTKRAANLIRSVRLNSIPVGRLRSFAVTYVPLPFLSTAESDRRSQFLAMHAKYEQFPLAMHPYHRFVNLSVDLRLQCLDYFE